MLWKWSLWTYFDLLHQHSCRSIEDKHEIRGPFERFVDWRQCTAVMQREAVTVMLNFSGGVT
jgi:hypothetical protein